MKRQGMTVVVAAAAVLAVLSLHARSAATDVPVMHEGHMEMSVSRQPRPGDRVRGDAIVAAGRALVARYANVAVAERDGYKKFLPNVPLPEEHYTNGRNAVAAQFAFDPNRPTSIIYRRTAQGLVAEGVMYTAPNSSDADQLDARVPLSLGTWHRHVNFCWSLAGAGDPRFGFSGSITTQAACDAAGGHFVPVVFNWMVHVWPLQSDPAKIWAVDAEGEHGMMHASGTVFEQSSLPIAIGRLPSSMSQPATLRVEPQSLPATARVATVPVAPTARTRRVWRAAGLPRGKSRTWCFTLTPSTPRARCPRSA